MEVSPAEGSEAQVEIRYVGVNRGEIAALDGSHVPAGGDLEVPGLECAGVVTSVGPGARGLAVGQPVGCLVYGGAYATHLVTHEVNVFPIPEGVPLAQAAASLEALVTAWEALVRRAQVRDGEVVLITGAAGSVGLAAISIARQQGAIPVAVCGAEWKAPVCRDAGAEDVVVGYGVDEITRCLGKVTTRGANVVVEVRGGESVAADLEVIALDGRIVLLGRLEGSRISFDLASINRRRATVMGFNLKERGLTDRRELFDEIRDRVWPHAVTQGWLNLPYQLDCLCQAVVVHDEIRDRNRVGSSVLDLTGSCGTPTCPGRP